MGATTERTPPVPPEGFKRIPAIADDADAYRRAAYEFLAVGEQRPDFLPELEQALLYVLANPAEPTKVRKYRKRWVDGLLRIGWMGYGLVVSEDWSGLDGARARALLTAADEEVRRRMEGAAWPRETEFPWHDQVAAHVMGIVGHYDPYEELRSYLFAFPAAQRVASFANWAVVPAVVEIRVPWGKARLWDESARYSWESGAIIGMLDLFGALRPGFSSAGPP